MRLRGMSALAPLLGYKRTRLGHCETDAVDPWLPIDSQICCAAQEAQPEEGAHEAAQWSRSVT